MAPATPTVASLPKDPSRLLAHRIDLYAKTGGSRAYASVPKVNQDLSQGYRDVSYAELSRATDRASWWLDVQLGKGRTECFAYIGPTDLRYVAVIVAAIKTGRRIFLPSAFVSIHASEHLFQLLQCDTLIFGTPLPPNPWVQGFTERHPDARSIEIPSFPTWFNDNINDHISYKYNKTWDEAIDEPVIVLHSSGTTGMPKLITYKNSTIVSFDAQYQLGETGHPLSINYFKDKRCWAPFPMGHLGGLYTTILHPVYFHTVAVMGPPGVPPSANLSDQLIKYANISSGFYPPFLTEDITSKPEALKNVLENLDQMQYGSAPLSKKAGDLLAKRMHIQAHYALTEVPFPPTYRLDVEDWEYMSFHPFAGIEFCHRVGDLHELVIIRHDQYQEFQPVFTIFSDAHSFSTGDLWSPHPVKAGLWKYRGRTDDIIVLSTGANVHTAAIESALQESSDVRAALVGGQGRARPYVLLELTETAHSTFENVTADTLWPIVRDVNERLELHSLAQIQKGQVIVAPQNKAFKRLAKGSVDRKGTTRDFDQEIEACLATIE